MELTDSETDLMQFMNALKADRDIGMPVLSYKASGSGQTIMYKFQFEPFIGYTGFNRTHLQIHPDGRRNGTAGCIGIQTYDDCKDVFVYLRGFKNMKLLVELY